LPERLQARLKDSSSRLLTVEAETADGTLTHRRAMLQKAGGSPRLDQLSVLIGPPTT
jgi:hypothetical protein